MKYDIFISYRREGGEEFARALKNELKSRGIRAFLDFDELKDGKFGQCIMDAIESSPIFMVILSPHSLDRCFDENDWVRKEIEYALEKNRHIIPINPNKTFSVFPESLPDHIRAGLGQHQFSEIMLGQLFKASIDKMIEDRLAPYLNCKRNNDVLSQGDTFLKIKTDVDCRVFVDEEEMMTASVGKINKLPLHGGSYTLRFVNVNCEDDFIEEDSFRIQPNTEEIYKVVLRPIQEERLQRERIIREENERKEREESHECKKRETEKWYQYCLQLSDEQIELYENQGKYGYRDKATGKEIIPCIYDAGFNFFDGLAEVKKDGLYGFVDKIGKEVIPCIYDYVCTFSEGLAAVKGYGRWGFVDVRGKLVIPFTYEEAYNFSEGLAEVRKNGKYGFIDKLGTIVIPCIYEEVSAFREGLAAVQKRGPKDILFKREGKYGFIDKSGKAVIPFVYEEVKSFHEGLAKVNEDGDWFYINKRGEWVKDV